MERGADGLRVDAVAQLIEDHYMRDEPPDPAYKPTGKETRVCVTSILMGNLNICGWLFGLSK